MGTYKVSGPGLVWLTCLDSGGQLGDRLGVINMLYPATLLCVILDLAMWLVATNGGTIIAFACIYGMRLPLYAPSLVKPSLTYRLRLWLDFC